MREGILELDKKVKDNYTKVIPVYNYGTKQEAQQLNEKWDRSIQKASIAIQKHSMIFDGEEKVKWIDDCYMLIGEAYFYKQEYISARRTFNFVIKEYNKTDMKYNAMLWLAQTYNQTGEYEKAEPLLNLVTKDVNEGKVPAEVVETLPQVYADHYVRQEKYDQALEYLYEAISYHPKRLLKTRLMFILAQIFEMKGDLYRASDLYAQVVKRTPPYEMAFQAKINMARSYDASTGDSKMIVKTLNKMLKDDKNKDFKDQIYFALSEVALKDHDTLLAINYLKKSVTTSTIDNYQKAKSSLTLADIYFSLPKYEPAQAYYDTAVMFIPTDYPNYDAIKARTNVLSDLVDNLITIQLQDSLQRLVNMSESDRNAVIDNLIEIYQAEQARLEEEAKLQKSLEAQQQVSGTFAGSGPSPQGLPDASGKWYFYNQSTKTYGYNEFIRKWGKRRYEDLWRLSNKQLSAFASNEEEEQLSDTTKSDTVLTAASDPLNRAYYLKDLPFSDTAMQESDKKIEDAYFNLGKLYRDGLKDDQESALAFETLNERFPENEYKLQVYYYLYKIFTETGDIEKAAFYKGLIIDNYPDSDYAKILSDPQYFAKLAAEKNKVAELYQETFLAYETGHYYMVITKSDFALQTYGDTTELSPKFAYLRAIAIGKTDITDSLVSNLQRIIQKYPNSEVKTLSQNVLAHLADENPEYAGAVVTGEGIEPEKPSPYISNPSSQHLFMMIVDSREVRLNPLKVKISDFNLKMFSLERLNINSIVLDNEHYMVTVGNFNSSEKAMEYFNAIVINDYVYADLMAGTFQNFIISTENYATFFKEKNIEEYQKFFDNEYKVNN